MSAMKEMSIYKSCLHFVNHISCQIWWRKGIYLSINAVSVAYILCPSWRGLYIKAVSMVRSIYKNCLYTLSVMTVKSNKLSIYYINHGGLSVYTKAIYILCQSWNECLYINGVYVSRQSWRFLYIKAIYTVRQSWRGCLYIMAGSMLCQS